MKISIYMGVSLDGFIARSNDGLDFLPNPPDGDDMGFSAFMASVDVLVMGRRTFEVVASFGADGWPYGRTRVVVLSQSLRHEDLPPTTPDTVSVSALSPAELASTLRDAGVRHIYVDGGRTAHSFLAQGLVTDLTVTIVPVLIGSGISLWRPTGRDIRLALVESRVQAGGLVQSHYRVLRD